jgi:uncharacterized membrane protein
MAEQESLKCKIEKWVAEGLISAEQGEALKQREIEGATPLRRVKADEVLVYLGSLVVFLAMAFLVGVNWTVLGSAGRILSVVVPTVAMLALGWWLRGSENARHRRGAQALWLSGCLLSAFCFGVTFHELHIIDDQAFLALMSCLLATGVAGAAFVLLTTVAQSVAFHLCGSATLITLLIWLHVSLIPPTFNHFYENLLLMAVCLVFGSLWLAFSEWLRKRERKELAGVSRIFGALTILYSALVLTMHTEREYPALWQKPAMEAIPFLASIAFIAASVKRQSQVFLYSGAAFLLFWIIHVNFQYFREKIGMPIALLIIGAVLIGVGLGTGRLSKKIRGG